MFYVYFAKSVKNNKIYVGLTEKNPIEKINEHNTGSNKWTNQNKPLKLIYFEKYFCKADATNREKFYKSGFGKQIKKLIVNNLNNGDSS